VHPEWVHVVLMSQRVNHLFQRGSRKGQATPAKSLGNLSPFRRVRVSQNNRYFALFSSTQKAHGDFLTRAVTTHNALQILWLGDGFTRG
jgi:hypothetical protein